jgi:hypothetical protein
MSMRPRAPAVARRLHCARISAALDRAAFHSRPAEDSPRPIPGEDRAGALNRTGGPVCESDANAADPSRASREGRAVSPVRRDRRQRARSTNRRLGPQRLRERLHLVFEPGGDSVASSPRDRHGTAGEDASRRPDAGYDDVGSAVESCGSVALSSGWLPIIGNAVDPGAEAGAITWLFRRTFGQSRCSKTRTSQSNCVSRWRDHEPPLLSENAAGTRPRARG